MNGIGEGADCGEGSRKRWGVPAELGIVYNAAHGRPEGAPRWSDLDGGRKGTAMKEKGAHKLVWARFRLQVIGPLLASPADQGELQGKIRELSERVYRHPLRPEKSVRFGFSTLERWYYQARETADLVAALTRKGRRDAGRREALSGALLKALEEQYAEHPRWTVQLHYDNLAAVVAAKPELGSLPSYQTVRWGMLEKGWLRRREPANPTDGQRRAAKRREAREIRSFEASHVHALWHLDFH